MDSSIIKSIQDAIHNVDAQLRSVSQSIHARPELAWQEHHAHDVLTDFMESKGFHVERHAYGFETAWKATYEVGQGGRVIGFNSESE
jgi:metal-dependent amidase/aminoacylase/carboxypeptidase family protein